MAPATSVSTSSPEPAESSSGQEATKTLSGFTASVMDQLSISSWLPALFLVGNAGLLLAMASQSRLDLQAAIENLAAMKWGALVVLLFAVISAAVSVQAFEFEILRFFEGYHRS